MRKDLIEPTAHELEGYREALAMKRDGLVREVEVYNHNCKLVVQLKLLHIKYNWVWGEVMDL